MADVDWNTVNIGEEEVTEDDAADIELDGASVPVGIYRCTVVESVPRQIDFSAYSCLGVRLKFEINQCLEVENKSVTGSEGEQYEGMNIYDDVAFADSEGKEKAGMTKRRKYVALRLGIITPGGKMTRKSWEEDTIGKQITLRLEENLYTDKAGAEKIGRPQVGFFSGYIKTEETAEVQSWDEI